MYSSPVLIVLAVWLYLGLVRASTGLDWSDYPQCAQPILDVNVPAHCLAYGISTVAELQAVNECLCTDTGDNGFLQNSARAIYSTCGCTILAMSGNTMVLNCANSYTPSPWDSAQFIEAGDGGSATACGGSSAQPSSTSTTTSAQPSSTTSSQSAAATTTATGTTYSSGTVNGGSTTPPASSTGIASSGGRTGGGGLSTRDQVIIGVVIPVIAIFIALGAWWCPCRRNR